MDNKPSIFDWLKTGLALVSGMTGFAAALIHSVGHVNHPLLVDKVAAALKQAADFAANQGAQNAAAAGTQVP